MDDGEPGSKIRAEALALVVLSLLGCASCPPPSVRASEALAPAAIDVDASGDALLHVTLESSHGTLRARSGPREDADEPECSTLWEWESRAHATWQAGVTVLAARSDVASDDGTPGGWMGMVLPLGDGRGVAVRSWTVDWAARGLGERDDELVAITVPDVTVAPLYAPGGRLRLMGILSGHAILLVSSRDGTHHVVAVDANGHEVGRTDAVAPPADVLGSPATSPTELGDAVPIDRATIAFPCTEAGDVCSVSFDGATLALSRLPIVRGMEDAGIADAEDFDGLPVDGALRAGLECDVRAAVARDVVDLDLRAPEDEDEVPVRSPAGIVLLDGPEGGANEIAFDLLVRGEQLAISYTRVDDTGAATQRRDLALALPAGSVEATPTDVGGGLGYRVRVHTTFPIHFSHDCWQGFWVLRTWLDGGGEAFTQSYAEYGYCD